MRISPILLSSMLVLACSGNPQPGENSVPSGGSNASTGGASTASGGNPGATGGTKADATGGTGTATAGTTAQGGGVTGGMASTGGAATGGATLRTGGTTSNGGAATGGTASRTGGSPSTGGAATGGAATGGAALGGATASTGGTTATGTAVVPGAIFVAPDGKDTNTGTIDSPFYTLAHAVTLAHAGTTIYMRGGKYSYSATIPLSVSGTEASPINVLAYQDEKPVLDFSTQVYASSNRGILMTGNYWRIKGLEICYAGDNGIKLEGNHNHIEQCVFHHNGDSGIQLGFGHETVNPNGELCAYNEIINCDSYFNFDFDNRGSDADGFACKMHNGKGNVFRGCRSWHNSDDGWDLYETDWPVEITNCWTWHNGDQTDFDAIYLAKMGTKMSSYSGNGNGFKLGGNGTGGSSVGTHVATNCVAFGNNFRSKKGFDQNSHKGGVLVRNCTAWGNGYNFMFEEDPNSGSTNEFDNNISFAAGTTLAFEFSAGAILRNNSWQLSVTANAADFIGVTEELAAAPRQADGSLPNNGFARLVAGSDLVDKGLNVGLPYNGSAPDLGAYEQ